MGIVDSIAPGTVLIPEDSLVQCSDQVVGTSGTVVHQVRTVAAVLGTCGHVWDAGASMRPWRCTVGKYTAQETYFSNCLKCAQALCAFNTGTPELRFPWHNLVLTDVVAQSTVDVAKCEVGARVSDWEEQRCIETLLLVFC